jgi:hypothetical protein
LFLKKQGFKTDFAVVIGALKNKYDQLNPQTLFRDPLKHLCPPYFVFEDKGTL